jgi:hypothetical protein
VFYVTDLSQQPLTGPDAERLRQKLVAALRRAP